MTTSAPTPAAVGAAMPDLTLQHPDGTATTLTAESDGAATLVYFMRTSTCPVCHAHLRALERLVRVGSLADHRVVVVVPGDPADAAHVARRTGPELRVLASADAHAQAGLGVSMTLQHSGTFLLDDRGVVRYRRTAAVPLRSFDERELVAHAQTPR